MQFQTQQAIPLSKSDTQFLRKLGMNLRQLRDRHGWSQETLGEKADLHDRTIGSIERGEMNPSAIIIAKLCHILECKPSDLLPEIGRE